MPVIRAYPRLARSSWGASIDLPNLGAFSGMFAPFCAIPGSGPSVFEEFRRVPIKQLVALQVAKALAAGSTSKSNMAKMLGTS